MKSQSKKGRGSLWLSVLGKKPLRWGAAGQLINGKILLLPSVDGFPAVVDAIRFIHARRPCIFECFPRRGFLANSWFCFLRGQGTH
jgi:hypothetical protein